MEQLSRTEITIRLGHDPASMDFLGQCYDAGPGNVRQCALLLIETRVVFTIKPKTGKGRFYISVEAIEQFLRWAPDLWAKLQTGHQFLQLRTKEVERQTIEQAKLKRLRESEQQFNAAKKTARYQINQYRTTIKKGALPEYLKAMKALLQRSTPYFEGDDAKALWFEQNTVAIEKMLHTSAAPASTVPIHATPASKAPASAFEPIPEIEF